jgi:uracil-DNA glycosylase
MRALSTLLEEVRACTLCASHLPHGPRPVLQADARARILITGQAPGRKVYDSGVPFDDASGNRPRPECAPQWRDHWPAVQPLPYPSPRNNIWLKAHPWFAVDVLPVLQARVRAIVDRGPL